MRVEKRYRTHVCNAPRTHNNGKLNVVLEKNVCGRSEPVCVPRSYIWVFNLILYVDLLICASIRLMREIRRWVLLNCIKKGGKKRAAQKKIKKNTEHNIWVKCLLRSRNEKYYNNFLNASVKNKYENIFFKQTTHIRIIKKK